MIRLCATPDCLRHYVRRCSSCLFRFCVGHLMGDLCAKCAEDSSEGAV